MRIGVLGGAFDPPHAAHAELARAAARQLHLDLVLWVPTFSPPHKRGPAVSFEHRTAMVRALVESTAIDPATPRFEVSELEAELAQPSYTLHTLRALKKRFDDADEWVLILGADNAATFHTWHQPDAVRAEAALAVYPRAGANEGGDRSLPPGAVMLNFPEMPDQSTEFRETLVRHGEAREAALNRLPAAVSAYIREHALYLDDASTGVGPT